MPKGAFQVSHVVSQTPLSSLPWNPWGGHSLAQAATSVSMGRERQ